MKILAYKQVVRHFTLLFFFICQEAAFGQPAADLYAANDLFSITVFNRICPLPRQRKNIGRQ